MKTPGGRWSTPIQLTCNHKSRIRDPGPGMAITSRRAQPTNKKSPHALTNLGMTGAVQRDHRKKIGSAPPKNCGPSIEPEFSGRQGCPTRVCSTGPFPQILLESWPWVDYRRGG